MIFKTAKIMAGLIAVSALSACAQFGKQAPLEEPTVPSLSQGQSVLGQNAWWLQLHDKKLNTLIAHAIRVSPDLRRAKSRFEQAQAQLGIVGAADKTQLELSGNGIGVYAAQKPASSQGKTDHNLLLANLALQGSWSFDFWGKSREQLAAVLGQRQAILYEANQTRIELAHAVAAQYFAWQALSERQLLLKQRIDLAEQVQQLLKRRIDAKLASSEVAYQAELAQQRLELEKLDLDQRQAKIRNALAALTGTIIDGLAVSEPESMKEAPVLPVGKLYADLLAARPDVAAQKEMLNSRLHQVKSTEAEFYPNIELKILAGLGHIDAFDVIRGRTSGILGIAPALNLPVFTLGGLQSRLAGRRAQYNEQVAIYDQTVLNAMRSAADAIVDYHGLQSRRSAWDKMLKIADKSVQAAKGRVKAGLDNGLFVLQRQDERLQLQAQVVQQKAELLTAWSNVHMQLGGGFKTGK